MPRCPNPRCQADYPPGTLQCTNPYCRCILPGAVVAGRYMIETLIGLGGMGAVYRVNDSFEGQQAALKVISTAGNNAELATAIERFRREARYAHQLRHKNIVPVLNFGQDGTLLYLVMPLITGGTLKSLLKAELPLPTALAQRYLNDLAEAIDEIHAHPKQIVHRDIKPSNLLIHQDDGRLVVADFGIARAMQEHGLTKRGWALGTEHYVAPEQEKGNAEPASDIYSMGVVAYQIFTGWLPFQAIVRSRATELPPPSKLNASLPAAIDAVILRAMEVEPANRYSSGRAFADALNKALQTPPKMVTPTQLPQTGHANMIVRTIIPENPCAVCGQENRSSSRFCRRCGHSLDDTSPLVTEVCQVGYFSDTGRRYVAHDNEDMLLVVQGLCANLSPPPRPFGLFAVADGLRGEHGKSTGGHEASRLAIETVADVLLPLLTSPIHSSSYRRDSSYGRDSSRSSGTALPQKDVINDARANQLSSSYKALPSPDSVIEDWLIEAVQRANQVIYHCNADYETNMASTLTVMLMYKRHIYVANVGDSRAYHYSANKGIHRITTDHTLAANLVEAHLFTPEDVYKSEKRKQFYRILGQTSQVRVDLSQHAVEVNDLVLLCTNGLWQMLHDDRLSEILVQGGDPQKLVRAMVDAANLAGGEGNVSAIVVKVQ
jgi:serine/threonine protein kinase